MEHDNFIGIQRERESEEREKEKNARHSLGTRFYSLHALSQWNYLHLREALMNQSFAIGRVCVCARL